MKIDFDEYFKSQAFPSGILSTECMNALIQAVDYGFLSKMEASQYLKRQLSINTVKH